MIDTSYYVKKFILLKTKTVMILAGLVWLLLLLASGFFLSFAAYDWIQCQAIQDPRQYASCIDVAKHGAGPFFIFSIFGLFVTGILGIVYVFFILAIKQSHPLTQLEKRNLLKVGRVTVKKSNAPLMPGGAGAIGAFLRPLLNDFIYPKLFPEDIYIITAYTTSGQLLLSIELYESDARELAAELKRFR